MVTDELILFRAGQLAQSRTADQLRERITEMEQQMKGLQLELPLTHIALALVQGEKPRTYWMERPWPGLMAASA